MSNAVQQQKAQQRREKFAELLREMFQLNQPELDFGLYRIMHARKDDINRFIEKDLPAITKAAFQDFASQDKAQLEDDLAAARKAAEDAGFNPDDSPKVKELQAQLKDGFDLAREEGEVYDALVTFFSRYYSEGDFLSRRVYKDGTYAIPYQGEEVVLHWANKGQYYIKSSETLRDYAFRLNADAAAGEDPMRVHFKLVDAEAGAKDNNKESESSKRVFVLDAEHPYDIVEGEPDEQGNRFPELQCRFVFRPATESDWTDKEKDKATAAAKKKAPSQDALRNIAVERLLGESSELAEEWKNALGQPYRKADGELADYTMLAGQLNNYTKKNTFDYFIHKDLGGFLSRELDFYIKNELLDWGDISALKNEPARLAPLLSKVEVIRSLGEKIIAFLSQLENFQKRLWLKKKFVTECHYCITLDQIEDNEDLLCEVFENKKQIESWEWLCGIDVQKVARDKEVMGWREMLARSEYRYLMLDTRFFNKNFKSRLLRTFDNLDRQCGGILVQSENFQALRFLSERFKGSVKCIYTDPPYNTGGDGFLYKDAFQHSSWMSMISDRIEEGSRLLSKDGLGVFHIDGNEQSRLEMVLDDRFGSENSIGTLIWKGATDNNPTRIATEHEYIVSYAKSKQDVDPHWSTSDNETKQLILDEFERIKGAARTIEELEDLFSEFMRSERDRLGDLYRYRRVDDEGPYVARRNMENPGKKGYQYDVMHPITKKPCLKPYWGWRFSEKRMDDFLKQKKIIFGIDEKKIPELKVYLKDVKFPLRSVFNIDARKGSNDLERLFGTREKFKNPKPVDLACHLLPYVTSENSCVLDCFAGSGTTGHAVLNMNREDQSGRKYILTEMGENFDSVILPRLKKVTYSSRWNGGKPVAKDEEYDGMSHSIKVLRLESYEDTIGNLSLEEAPRQQGLLNREEGLWKSQARHSYLLNYMLEVETRNSQSLLNTRSFIDPEQYELKVTYPGAGENKPINVDLLETFNYLLGLEVDYIAAPIHFDAELSQGEYGRWQAKVKRQDDGKWWFRTVYGTNRNGQKVLVVWRNLPSVIEGVEDGIQYDNAVLDAVLIEKLNIRLTESQDDEVDLLYVNGDHNIAIPRNRKGEPMEQARIQLIEEAFHRLMFADTESVQ